MNRSIFTHLVLRTLRGEYLHNLSGFAWVVLQPLMLLAVYSFVFTTIFRARIPELEPGEFVPYLAVAFWPWTAFSEAVLRASNVVTTNAALIGKVAFDVELLPLSTVTATFIMHMAGYLAVLVVLQLSGTDVQWVGILPAIVILVVLFVFACSLALLFSALQVFVRDLSQMLPPIMMFWFFMTPILYSPSLFPENLQFLIQWNPMGWFVGELRNFLYFGSWTFDWTDLILPACTAILAFVSFRFFRRMSGHFEDFL